MDQFFKGWSVFIFVPTKRRADDTALGYHVIAENLIVAKNMLGAYFQRECPLCSITLCRLHSDLTLQKEAPLTRMVVCWKTGDKISQGQVVKYGDA
ncbi:MAG TPA: hypothetical protein VI935_01105 [Thermodesulfobacteriota bacterium]|nr:hypothetical protein [Thermodesulfobacteriota bacterium]